VWKVKWQFVTWLILLLFPSIRSGYIDSKSWWVSWNGDRHATLVTHDDSNNPSLFLPYSLMDFELILSKHLHSLNTMGLNRPLCPID
jgi:hypothetical protein